MLLHSCSHVYSVLKTVLSTGDHSEEVKLIYRCVLQSCSCVKLLPTFQVIKPFLFLPHLIFILRPDISPISSLMVEMCWFHRSMFHWTKLKFQHRLLGDSSLSLTSIQPSTVHGCFSSATVSCFPSLQVLLMLYFGFSGWKSHFLQLLSYSSLTNIDSCFFS